MACFSIVAYIFVRQMENGEDFRPWILSLSRITLSSDLRLAQTLSTFAAI